MELLIGKRCILWQTLVSSFMPEQTLFTDNYLPYVSLPLLQSNIKYILGIHSNLFLVILY